MRLLFRTGPWLGISPGLLALCVALLGAAEPAPAEAQVHERAEDVQPLEPGAPVPAVNVRTVGGEVVGLRALGEDGCLLVFYRGGW